MRREKHMCGSGGRELPGQEESTGVYRSVLGTGWEGREWSKDLQASIWQLHLMAKAFRSHSS